MNIAHAVVDAVEGPDFRDGLVHRIRDLEQRQVGWRELLVGGLIAAMGFSVGLFFCDALLPPGQLRSEMRMGVLLSLVGAPLALVSARLLRVGRFSREGSTG